MAQVLATIFLLAIIAGVAKMVFDVQITKVKRIFKHLLK